MPTDQPPAEGWSFTASGNQTDKDHQLAVQSALNSALDQPASGCVSRSIRADGTGWVAEAAGRLADSEAHRGLAHALGTIISDAKALCGHSSFTSPFISLSNYHTPPAAAPAPAAPVSAGGAGAAAPAGTAEEVTAQA